MTATTDKKAPADATWVDDLRARLTGRVIVPTDADYEKARTVMAGHVERYPAAIARVANATDVATVIKVARKHGIEVAVRSGGHDGEGASVVDSGVVIDLRDMKKIEIDPVKKTAWADSGLNALEVTKAAAEHKLVIGFGDTGSVGIGGITLGGGIGYLVRKHGLTINSVLAAEIVTADGKKLFLDCASHPELFWAIRGGGGNFGVVTRFRYRLHDAESFVGGMLVLPATAETVSGFMRLSDEAPEELGTIANVMNCPPLPFVDEKHHGEPVIFALLGWTGDKAAGEAEMAKFRALAAPLGDTTGPMAYPDMYGPEDDSYRPKAIGHTFFTGGVDKAAGQRIVDAIETSDSPMRAVQLRTLGGAMARVPAGATAFAHRSARVMAIVVSFYESDDDRAKRQAWVDDLSAGIADDTPGAYVNFATDAADEIRRAYPPDTLARLAKIKQQYDPTNFFHGNRNITPAV